MGGYGFGTGIEPDAIQSQHVLVAKEGILISGEWEIGRGNRDPHVDADHTAIGQERKLAGVIATLCKDHRAVGKGIRIHNGQPLLKAFHPFHQSDRAKNLPLTDDHLRGYMIQNGRSDKVAAFIAGDGNAAAIQNQLGSLVNSQSQMDRRCFSLTTGPSFVSGS